MSLRRNDLRGDDVELGWTYREVVGFGEHFFGRDFEERSKEVVLAQLHQECKRYRLLVMRACKMPGADVGSRIDGALVSSRMRKNNILRNLPRREGP